MSQKELPLNWVAVLPFDNLSDDRENTYFSDGITDDIMSSMQYKGSNRPIAVGLTPPSASGS